LAIRDDIILKTLTTGAEVTGTARNFSPIVIGNRFLVAVTDAQELKKNFVLLKVNEKLV